MPKPLVSIITVNFNQPRVTCDMLDTLQHINYENIEVFVVDNGSAVDSSEIVTKHPWVKFIKSEKNLGFAGGNNLAIKESRGEFILLINNDTIVPPDFLDPLVEILLNKEDVGIVSPKILYHNSGDTIQYAGATEINLYTGRGNKIGFGQKDSPAFRSGEYTGLAHGACMLVRASLAKQIGGLPELYFLYYEEHDFCLQVKRLGYKIYVERQSYIYHRESMSIGKRSPLKTYYMARNRLVYIRRNSKGIQKLSAIFFFCLVAAPKNLFTHLIKKQYGLLQAYWKGIVWNISHPTLPSVHPSYQP